MLFAAAASSTAGTTAGTVVGRGRSAAGANSGDCGALGNDAECEGVRRRKVTGRWIPALEAVERLGVLCCSWETEVGEGSEEVVVMAVVEETTNGDIDVETVCRRET